jgi:hypothetical protein
MNRSSARADGLCAIVMMILRQISATLNRRGDMRCQLALTIVCSSALAVGAQEILTETQLKEAIALGRACGDVPIVKVGTKGGDFNVFLEDPFARIALRAAAARQMHQPFDVSNVRGDVAALDYRIWVQYILEGRRTVSVDRVVLQQIDHKGRNTVIQPVRARPFQLTVGHLPAHGIMTEVRWRNWEWIFDRLPVGEFHVVLETSAGVQRYRVTSRDRAASMKICP